MESRLGEVRYKEVICVSDGTRYGYVGDLILDLESGALRELVVPGQPRFFGLFGRTEDALFRWDQVRQFGEDIILGEGEPELRRLPRLRRSWL